MTGKRKVPLPQFELMDKEELKEKYVPVRVSIGKIIEEACLQHTLVPPDIIVDDEKDWLVKSIIKGIKPLIEFGEESVSDDKEITAELKIFVKKDLLKKSEGKEDV